MIHTRTKPTTLRAASLMAAALTLFAAGCAQSGGTERVQSAGETQMGQKTDSLEPVATIKPGAAIQLLSSQTDGSLSVGSYTDVVVTLSPDYVDGIMRAKATGSEGLEILGSSATLQHDMSKGDVTWRVTVRPADDGVHYLSLLTTVSGEGVTGQTARTFSVKLDLGGNPERKDQKTSDIVVDDSGRPLVIMDADETIDPQ